MSKPVLWVSLTSGGRGQTSASELEELKQALNDEVGDDYNIVVADDRVRLATLDDIKDLKDQLDSLLPSEVENMETRAEREQERREEISGLSAESVMGNTDDPQGVEPPADEGDDA